MMRLVEVDTRRLRTLLAQLCLAGWRACRSRRSRLEERTLSGARHVARAHARPRLRRFAAWKRSAESARPPPAPPMAGQSVGLHALDVGRYDARVGVAGPERGAAGRATGALLQRPALAPSTAGKPAVEDEDILLRRTAGTSTTPARAEKSPPPSYTTTVSAVRDPERAHVARELLSAFGSMWGSGFASGRRSRRCRSVPRRGCGPRGIRPPRRAASPADRTSHRQTTRFARAEPLPPASRLKPAILKPAWLRRRWTSVARKWVFFRYLKLFRTAPRHASAARASPARQAASPAGTADGTASIDNAFRNRREW